ncbi:glycerate kinase [Serinibacter arcticus]|uniref:glycerate kinase n=1 Tax=Serinibacter arcticus TaxID=1655435 RepID=UPI00130497A3|nr:glycerate kinase [Serinibacter arcticus]
MRIVLTAGDLGGLPGREVADALAAGWREANPDAEVVARGASDGAGGLLDAVEAALGGSRVVTTAWRGDLEPPTPVPVVVLHRGGTVYVQARDVLGDGATATLASATRGTSHGLGQLVAGAIDGGARRVVVGTGTPATLDAGVGMLRALAGHEPQPGDHGLERSVLEDLVASARTRCDGVELVLVADELVPARGLRGAAARLIPVLGPAESQLLDTALAPVAAVLGESVPRRRDLLGSPGAPTPAGGAVGSGCGGGLGLAVAALGGRVVAGPAFVAAETDLVGLTAGRDLVVVLTERIDPVEADRGVLAAVAGAAAAHGVAVLALGRSVRLDRRAAATAGVSATAELTGAGVADGPVTADELRSAIGRHALAWRW